MEVIQVFRSGVPLLRVVGDIDHGIDSGGLAVILDAVSTVRGRGWVGALRPNANVSRLPQIVGLLADECFVILADETQAAKRIDASGQKASSLSST